MNERNKQPIACSLTTAQLGSRQVILFSRFRSAAFEVEELQEGFAFRFPGDGKWMILIAELMVAERECCPFLTFDLTAQADNGPFLVRVTGPTGTKELLRGALGIPHELSPKPER